MPDHDVITVGIVEDEPDLRDGFSFLVRRSSTLSLVWACASGEDAVEILPRECPAVVLMDIQLPGMNGIECIRQLKQKCPHTQFIVLTVFEHDDVIFGALEAGASGYILKTAAPEVVLDAIREVDQGGAPMSSQIARRVIERFRMPPTNLAPAHENAELNLTDREREVLQLLARGHLYKEIADQLKISVETVRKHLGRIYKKLHVNSRTEAVVKYLGK